MLRKLRKKQNKLLAGDTVIFLEKPLPLLRKSRITHRTSAGIIKGI